MLNKSLRPKTDKDFGAPPVGYVAGRGRGATGFASGVSRDGAFKPVEEKDGDLGDGNYDEFSGYGGSLFKGGTFDAEDKEADDIYDFVDARMESRRKKARSLREADEFEEAKSALGFQKQFTNCKGDLAKVSEAEWMALPDAQERLKSKKVKREFLQAVPDRLIVSDQKMESAIVEEPEFSINEVGVAKQAVLTVSLDKECVAGDSTVDPEGYLSQLDKSSGGGIGDIGEIKKARLLFRSITKSDPANATAWLALARLEEVANNVAEAKAILASGIVHCASAEDLWLSAVRLETNAAKAKSIIANGIRQNPQSTKLWVKAASLEDDINNKKKVYQKALEFVKLPPANIELWKGLINLSSNLTETLLLLQRSVQACPNCEELWLMYAKLSTDDRQKILNEARRAIPTSVAVWVAAAALAEKLNAKSVEPILAKGIESLAKHGVVLERKDWYSWAVKCEQSGDSLVAKVLVKLALLPDLTNMLKYRPVKEVKHRIVYADWQNLASSSPIVARAVLETAVLHVPELANRKGIWVHLIEANPSIGLYERSVSACPTAEVLWLMYAKYLWTSIGDSNVARNVLERAVAVIEDCEDLYLAMVKLAVPTKKMHWLQIGRSKCSDCVRLWIKSAQLIRQEGSSADKVAQIVNEGLASSRDDQDYKLWLIAVHAFLEASNLKAAKEWASRACEACPTNSPVWLVAADIAIIEQDWSRARSILERGRLRQPAEENLWWKGLQVELKDPSVDRGRVMIFLSRALQACPSSGLLWSWAITLEPTATRHPKCLDALKRCQTDPLVVAAVGMFFWREKQQIEKARKWFQNAVKLDPKYGQVWADFLALEISLGDENLFNIEPLVKEIVDMKEQPNKGIEWNQVVKRIDNWNNSFLENLLVFIAEFFPEINHNSPKISQLIHQSSIDAAKLVKPEY